MSVAECVRISIRSWYILVLCGVIGGGAVLGIAAGQTRVYRVSARVAVGPAPDVVSAEEVNEIVLTLNKRVVTGTFAEVLRSDAVLRLARARIHLPAERAEQYSVRTVREPEASAIGLEVDGPEPDVATSYAVAIATEGDRSIEGFYPRYSVRLVVRPVTPTEPVRPRPGRDAPVGAAVGVGVGFLAAVVRDRLRPGEGRHFR